jgi:para-aminobenzoate synthetase
MPKYLLIDNGSIHTEALARLLPETPRIIGFGNLDSIDASVFDAVILSGGSQMPVMGNEQSFVTEISLIRNTAVPLIGICLGAELIGHAFGGKLRDLGEKRKGLIQIISTDEDSLLLENGRLFDVYEAHRWTIDRLPNEFRTLAQSDHGPEIIKHISRPIWGLQFHPEHLSESTLGDEIFLRILARSLLN